MLLVWACLFVPLFLLGNSTVSKSIDTEFTTSLMVDPELIGPDNLCMVFGSVVGTFSGGGDPASDVYTWLVTGPNGEEIFRRSGGIQYETIEVSFNSTGAYRVDLSVRRNADIILTDSKSVQVAQGPELVALPDYLICGNSPTEITAINPNTPNLNQYVFKWTDALGNIVGNTNTISVTQEGYYFYELFFQTSTGQQVCTINGTTYAGPSLDFFLGLSDSSLCQRQWLYANVDRPISGDWFLIKPNSTTRELVGKGYEVSVGGSDLSTIGTYTLIFNATDPNYPTCSSERQETFEVTEGPAFLTSVVEEPDDCGAFNGSIQVEALSPLDSLFVLEAGFSATNVNRNETFVLPNREPRVYTIVGYHNGCENVELFVLDASDPPFNDPEIQITPESCTPDGTIDGSVQIVFTQGAITGKYRLMGRTQGSFFSGNIQENDTLSFTLPGGVYLLELEIDGCILPVKELRIPTKQLAEFSIPGQVVICESYVLTPQTSQDLTFTLKFPDQTEQTIAAGESFNLSQIGDYELLGQSSDPTSGLCPTVDTFTATASPPFSFNYSVLNEDCFGNQVYRADLTGYLPSQTSIRWRNDKNEIVGRSVVFYAPGPGDYSLFVEPLNSGSCNLEPVYFNVEAPIFNTEVLLEANKICPDPGTSLVRLTTDLSIVSSIEWIFFDNAGNRRDLPQYDDQTEITVDTPGNYEAVVYNRIGCEMGRDFIPVEVSTLLDLPKIDPIYGICTRGSKSVTIDPGEYVEYYWYLDDELVSTDPTYTPKEVGNFLLRVVTADGCEFTADFKTYDGCNFEYALPNAMILGDPNRALEITVNIGITNAELFIINRQGALVHHQQAQDIAFEGIIFEWDGTSNGNYIVPGTYAVILIGRNANYGFEQKITGSLLVIE